MYSEVFMAQPYLVWNVQLVVNDMLYHTRVILFLMTWHKFTIITVSCAHRCVLFSRRLYCFNWDNTQHWFGDFLHYLAKASPSHLKFDVNAQTV